ncbi:aldose 1-epimerase family protein [Nocardioides sp. Soil805]|uniref:aldose 1-epimerase family protein n=1 Tax=Nocardioides sp. Soil805 TaxID=1736416 RepID=UPI0007027D1E|nr:aldose 1-epimerase family protein [Nocardioides sp. Soil805]KRF35957.1 aldose epimerase [Nocardioides sp. Soil805]
MSSSHRVAPSGDQYEITAAGYRAVVTESGGALRVLEHGGRALVDGFGEDEMSAGGRGQLLMPWTNRIRDGRYSFGGRDHQLALTEPKRSHASHGLARWAAWTLEEHTANSVSLVYRVMAQSGYPWAVDLHVLYDLGADGLTVTQTATNLSGEPAPYACGAHPYLCVGDGIDHLELTLPAGTRTVADDRLIPVETVPVDAEHDFRTARVVGTTAFDEAYGDLSRTDGVATATLRDPGTGNGVALWVDERLPWLQVYSADDAAGRERRSLAVEPMTAPADAFNSGVDLVTLAPGGEAGDELSVTWGIQALLASDETD